MIRVLTVVTALLPLILLAIIGLVVVRHDVPNGYALPLTTGFIILVLFIWRGRFLARLLRSSVNETGGTGDEDCWQKLRIRTLASLTALALLSTILNLSFGDVRSADYASSAALYISALRIQNTYMQQDDVEACVAQGGSYRDCTACLLPTTSILEFHGGPSSKIGPITIGYSVFDCHTMRVQADGMTPLSCTFFMQWIDTAWLSAVRFGDQATLTDQLNRDYAAPCHDQDAPFAITLDYKLPTLEAFRETAS